MEGLLPDQGLRCRTGVAVPCLVSAARARPLDLAVSAPGSCWAEHIVLGRAKSCSAERQICSGEQVNKSSAREKAWNHRPRRTDGEDGKHYRWSVLSWPITPMIATYLCPHLDQTPFCDMRQTIPTILVYTIPKSMSNIPNNQTFKSQDVTPEKPT
jgi:hypothetical protein